LTEELTFRSSLIAVSLLGGLSPKSIVFGTPLWFGVAHAHHAIEVWKKGGSNRSSAIQALAGCGTSSPCHRACVLVVHTCLVFQLGYTTLFGWYASYLFIRTGSIIPPLLSHAFCNYMGIYLPSSAIQRFPSKRRSECCSLILWLRLVIVLTYSV
jgi:prenyl protein peptidase